MLSTATFNFVSALLLALLPALMAHKDGAPTSACLTMTPGHDGAGPQPLDSALHKLEFAPTPVKRMAPASANSSARAAQSIYLLTLSAKDGAGATNPFKGFFVQARSTTAGNANPVGTFEIGSSTGLAKGVDCAGVKNSAATHVDARTKPSVTLLWTPPQNFQGKVIFVATVVQEFKKFWIGIQSSALSLEGGTGGGLGSGAGILGNKIGSNNSSSSSSSPSTPLVPPPGLSNKYLANNSNKDVAHPLGSAKATNGTNGTSGNGTTSGGRRADGSSGGVGFGAALAFAAAVWVATAA